MSHIAQFDVHELKQELDGAGSRYDGFLCVDGVWMRCVCVVVGSWDLGIVLLKLDTLVLCICV